MTDPNSNVVFERYARFYDLLYRDKDYAGEARFVHEQLVANGAAGFKLLELGCGTGRHAVEFARLGYDTTGVDLSCAMVQQAIKRAGQLPGDEGRRLRFMEGDIRTVRTNEKYDAAVSLFHVINYQTTHADLQAAFATAAVHLKPGGIFLFDFWYGPAVLSDPPVVRVKRLEDDGIQATRIAEPELRPNENVAVVNYQVFIRDKQTGGVAEVRESHPMRYLFLPEMARYLETSGLALCHTGAWCSTRPLNERSWYGFAVGRYQG